MKKLLPPTIALLIACATAVPALCKQKKQIPDFFASPDTQTGAPAFNNRPAQMPTADVMLGLTGEAPRMDVINRLPSLSSAQRKQINDLVKGMDEQTRPLKKKIDTLRRKISERKSGKAPVIASTSGPSKLPVAAADPDDDEENGNTLSPEEMQKRMEELQGQLKTTSKNIGAQFKSILSPEQLSDMEGMTRGSLNLHPAPEEPKPAKPNKPSGLPPTLLAK